jgi:hypothetical protein
MSVLQNSPFNLNFQQLVIVQVRAVNHFGTSAWSPLNTAGAHIRRVPA